MLLLRSLPWVHILLALTTVVIAGGQQLGLATERDPNWEAIQLSHVLRVGLDPSYRPFEFWQENEMRGFDVDLASALAQQLDLEPQLVPIGMDSFYDALRLRKIDVVISALVPIPEYRKEVAYSRPYMEAGTILLVSPNSQTSRVQDLEGKRIAVEYGSDAHRVARRLQRDGLHTQIITADSPREAAEQCLSGKADAVLLDGPTASWFLLQRQLKSVAVVESVPYVVATRADSPQLLQRINSALQELQRNGEIRRLQLRWLQP